MDAKTSTSHPVFYAGRFADGVPRKALPDDCLLLDDWAVLPGPLADAADGASVVIVWDLLSFPFEALVGEARDVPLVLALPAGRDAKFLSAVFGETVFGGLGFFDGIATPDTDTWQALRRRYGWAEGQRVAAGEDPGGLISDVLAGMAGGERWEKAAHRTRESALLPRFAAARGLEAGEVPMDVLQVGVGDGRWATGFDPATTRFSGVDEDERALARAAQNFPEGGFRKLGPELSIPHPDEGFDLTFCVDTLGDYPAEEKRALTSEMWRVTRPGGRLLFLEDFVGGDGSAPYVVSVNAFVDLLMGATAGQVVLEHVESLRYPGEDTVRGGVLALSRLGVPGRW
ncbi:methyltransferase domain-containing protein [Rubrobacter tropicus]|uniref:Methyltransferase domain-containing protein n=1 Tax=Rubrobacter tropicus TaxID=2653851 RepID=A0A6G8QCI1_9ACTN|nr:class I SAM-dependent methyltransferase [Rubrobacter tropicus]QIN84205.1 methyltransferase domain-containing protein [Rubrobacter tropicus]